MKYYILLSNYITKYSINVTEISFDEKNKIIAVLNEENIESKRIFFIIPFEKLNEFYKIIYDYPEHYFISFLSNFYNNHNYIFTPVVINGLDIYSREIEELYLLNIPVGLSTNLYFYFILEIQL